MKRKGHFKVTPGPGGSVRIERDGVVWFLSVEQARVLGALLSVVVVGIEVNRRPIDDARRS